MTVKDLAAQQEATNATLASMTAVLASLAARLDTVPETPATTGKGKGKGKANKGSANVKVVVRENEELGGTEIVFSGKPSVGIRTGLKSAGFRFSFGSQCWYHKSTAEARKFASDLAAELNS